MKELGRKNKMKKRIAFINVVCNGSTGKIMCDLAKIAHKDGFETYCFFGRGKKNKELNCIKIGNKFSIYFHVLLSRFGLNGRGSYFTTKKLIKKLRKLNPQIIHLHNIHGYYINLKLLFNYLKNEYKGKIFWTLHDCWAFTGHCSHFTYVNCKKWEKCCYKCPQLNCYPKEFIDTTKREYKLKKQLFNDLNNMTLITPSKWLKELVDKSFLKNYKVMVINNGIDLKIFKPTLDNEIFKKYSIPSDKKIILGVSNVWNNKKGLNIFKDLSKEIDANEIILLVGLNKKQLKNLPKNIIGICRTDNQLELAKIYSIAKVLINPSYEETFSLVTLEAMACGIPVVACGMSAIKELITEENGIVLNKYLAKDYYEAYKLLEEKNLNKEKIINYAQGFSKEKMTAKNIELYKE